MDTALDKVKPWGGEKTQIDCAERLRKDSLFCDQTKQAGGISKQDSPVGIDTASPQLADQVEKYKEPVDISKIWDKYTPILCIGEDHAAAADQRELLKLLPSLVQNGMNTLAIEFLRSDKQGLLDKFMEHKLSDKEMMKLLSDSHEANSWHPDETLKVLKFARDHKIRVKAIDKAQTNDDIRDRNKHWTDIVYNVSRLNPHSRTVVWGGAGHFGYEDRQTVNAMLSRKGLGTRVVVFNGQDGLGTQDLLQQAISQKHLSNSEFMLPVSKGSLARFADYVINSPEQ